MFMYIIMVNQIEICNCFFQEVIEEKKYDEILAKWNCRDFKCLNQSGLRLLYEKSKFYPE